MGSLMLGGAILVAAFLLFTAAAGRRSSGTPSASATLLRTGGWLLTVVGAIILVSSSVIVIDAGQVGVRHAFGEVDETPLLPGVRFVTPWSNIERFSSREEQFPARSDEAEQISALSSEQMGMQVDVAVRWQIDPMQAPHIFRELGAQEQIKNVVLNAIRNGVRDGMVQFSINDIHQRNRIASTMSGEVDSALVTTPRAGGERFRIATVTAFFLRDLQPPPAGGSGDQQQDRPGTADRDRAPPRGGRPAPGRAAAVAQSDAHGGSPDEAIPRGTARPPYLEQHSVDRADGGWDAGAGRGSPAEEPERAQIARVPGGARVSPAGSGRTA